MITIPVYIYDENIKLKTEQENERNSNLGLPIKEVSKAFTVDMYVRESALNAFWVDPDIDIDIGTKNVINFYIASSGFKTPYNVELIQKFIEILQT